MVVLRSDPNLAPRAETALKARSKLWDEASELAKKAKSADLTVVAPGPSPTLDEILSDQERQPLFRIIEDLVLWENTTDEKKHIKSQVKRVPESSPRKQNEIKKGGKKRQAKGGQENRPAPCR